MLSMTVSYRLAFKHYTSKVKVTVANFRKLCRQLTPLLTDRFCYNFTQMFRATLSQTVLQSGILGPRQGQSCFFFYHYQF